MSLDAVERQGMPFRGETGGVGAGQGMGELPGTGKVPATEPLGRPVTDRHEHPQLESHRSIPLDADLQARLEAARRAAAEHPDHLPRAPRPEKLQR
jgi:hypothetical protein